MAGENGKNGQGQKADNGRDPVTGQFVKGYAGGPGRPAGTLNFMRICRIVAKEAGLTEEELFAVIVKGLIKMVGNGDTRAAQILLDRGLGPVASGPDVAIQVNNNRIGPPIRSGPEFKKYVQDLYLDVVNEGDGASSGEE